MLSRAQLLRLHGLHGLLPHQAPLSTGFPRPEYCSALPFPSPGNLLNTGIQPTSLATPTLASRFFTTEPPGIPWWLFTGVLSVGCVKRVLIGGAITCSQHPLDHQKFCWIIKKAREFQKNIYFCLIDYAKAFDCGDHNKLWKNSSRDGKPPSLPPEKSVCRSRSNSLTWSNRLVPKRERSRSRLYVITLLI